MRDEEFQARRQQMQALRDAVDADYQFEMFDLKAGRTLLPSPGDAVAGVSYLPTDGHVNRSSC